VPTLDDEVPCGLATTKDRCRFSLQNTFKAKDVRAVVMTTALGTVLVACAPQDPLTYAHMVCADEDRLLPGSDEYAACVEFMAENPPSVLLALGGATLGPVKAAADGQVN
jgi:hypothetical protein